MQNANAFVAFEADYGSRRTIPAALRGGLDL
jgi:hypothetical protein